MQSETQSKPQPDISKRHLLINPSSPTSSNSLPTSSITFPTESTPPSTSPPPPHPSNTKINPTLILVISILAALFFIFLLIHFLLFHSRRRRLHHHHHSSNSLTLPSPRHTYTTTTTTAENSDSNALRRLFRLHDSGLDQSIIDALPVFLYREISACTKKAAAAAGEEEEPFDCAVCLSEFAREDKLRLIPACGHAFHLHCIDTWLMANSTCPLCRSTLVDAVADFYPTGASFDWFGGVEGNVNGDSSSERGGGGGGGGSSSGRRKQPTVMEEVEQGDRRRVYSVRLGKFRCVNLGEEEESSREMEMERISNDIGETGHHSISVDDRRCYSMGSYRYVLGESELLVSLSSSPVADRGGDARGGGGEMSRGGGESGDLEVEGGGEEGKRISRRSRGESFSVSKIWLWSKKNKCKFDGRTNVDREIGARGVGVGSGLPLTVNYKLDKS